MKRTKPIRDALIALNFAKIAHELEKHPVTPEVGKDLLQMTRQLGVLAVVFPNAERAGQRDTFVSNFRKWIGTKGIDDLYKPLDDTERQARLCEAVFQRILKDLQECPTGKLPLDTTLTVRGREKLVDGVIEAGLQKAFTTPQRNIRISRLRQQAWLVMVILQDTGMRPQDVFTLRIENLDYANNRIWIPSGKTANSRRFVGMSERMRSLLKTRCTGRTEGWVFPSTKSKSGHLTTIHKGFRAACDRQNIEGIVPYSARRTYGTFGMTATKNVFVVAKAMGHADIKSMEPYQHPELTELNQAIDRRNRERDIVKNAEHLGHTSGHTASVVTL